MPVKRISKKELDELTYVSMADFSKRIDEIKHIDDKLKFARQYLIMHGTSGEPDCSLDDAINIARMKIADAAYDLRQLKSLPVGYYDKIDFNPELDDEEPELSYSELQKTYAINPHSNPSKDLELELFMGFPGKYLKNFASEEFQRINSQEAEDQKETKFKETCMKFCNKEINVEKNELNIKQRRRLHINNRLEARFGGKDALEKARNDIRPGFFSKLFATTSPAGSNLEAAYKGFNDPKHVLYGDVKAIEKAANEYLIHKIPNWSKGKAFPTDEVINKLDSTEKARTILSIAILQAVDKEYKNEEVYDKIVKGCASDIDLQDTIDTLGIRNQESFHNKLLSDLHEEYDNNLLSSNNQAKEVKKENIIDTDESVLDKTVDEPELKLQKKSD